MPKRALEETGAIPDASDGTSLPSSSEELTPSSSQGEDCREDGSPPRKCKRKSVGFNDVTVYYFQRMQGFTCVPSQGGSTLGMGPVHTEKKTFSLKQHSDERRREHFPRMEPSSSSSSPTDETLTSFEDCGSASANGKFDDDDEDQLEGGEDEDVDTLNYLQPVPTRQRRALLRASGVRKIDALEKDECRDIRASREFCGCACRGRCLPQECSCSQAGIPCQVDRMSFPCGCTREGCANESGRTEFNPLRVRAHFLHTLMRLELEKQQHQREGCDSSSQLSIAANLNFHRLNPRALMYYSGGSVDTTAVRYSSEEEEEEDEEEETSYSENSDYSTEDETEETREGSYDGTSDDRHSDSGDPLSSRLNVDVTSLDYTDLSEAVPKDSAATEERREATRGVVPVDPVFVGCGDDCATTGLEQTMVVNRNGRMEDGKGSSSTATTDSTFGEIIKASLGEVSTL